MRGVDTDLAGMDGADGSALLKMIRMLGLRRRSMGGVAAAEEEAAAVVVSCSSSSLS